MFQRLTSQATPRWPVRVEVVDGFVRRQPLVGVRVGVRVGLQVDRVSEYPGIELKCQVEW